MTKIPQKIQKCIFVFFRMKNFFTLKNDKKIAPKKTQKCHNIFPLKKNKNQPKNSKNIFRVIFVFFSVKNCWDIFEFFRGDLNMILL